MRKGDQAPDWIDDESPKPLSRGARIATDLLAILLIPFCFWAGWFEFQRAIGGRLLAWVYTFEWPFFGIIGIWLWRRIRKGDFPTLPKIEPPKFDEDERSS